MTLRLAFRPLLLFGVLAGWDLSGSAILTPSAASDEPRAAHAQASPPSASPRPLIIRLDENSAWVDHTAASFNPCGVPVLPFLKLACADLDSDGAMELVAGGKNGRLTLFRRVDGSAWRPEPGYFDGVGEGVFAAPTLGDLDGDGALELVVGTGGFSSHSGRVLVYANRGTAAVPRWERWAEPVADVGDDAAPAAVDYDLDGHCDLVVGNSAGRLTLLRNDGRGRLEPEPPPPALRRAFGMYATPGGIRLGQISLLAVGSSAGQISFFKLSRTAQGLGVQEFAVSHPRRDFYAPLFVTLRRPDRVDLLLADGDGGIQYFEQQTPDRWAWSRNLELFQNRLLPGPVSAPVLSRVGGRPRLVVGNMDGQVHLYDLREGGAGPRWREWAGYFLGVRVTGYARADMTEWEGQEVLLVGQGSGEVAAWRNAGNSKTSRWVPWSAFTSGVRVRGHSAPCLFDLDGDGRGELVVGAADGRLTAFRSLSPRGGPPWEAASGLLGEIRVGGYAVPSFIRLPGGAVAGFVGQQDGRIRLFVAPAEAAAGGFREVTSANLPPVQGFASPWADLGAEGLDLYVGDYDGNLRHFRLGSTPPAVDSFGPN